MTGAFLPVIDPNTRQQPLEKKVPILAVGQAVNALCYSILYPANTSNSFGSYRYKTILVSRDILECLVLALYAE